MQIDAVEQRSRNPRLVVGGAAGVGAAPAAIAGIVGVAAAARIHRRRNSGGMDRALTNCFINMIRWLVDDYGISKREAYLHMIANSLVRINVYRRGIGVRPQWNIESRSTVWIRANS
jgi:hypothetical protein